MDSRRGEEIVAQVGRESLYRSDIEILIPPGTSYNDSLMMLRQYVNSWALKHLLLERANQELSKSDKDVERELMEYKHSLIAYRYEKLYIESRLDTVVNEAEASQYFIQNANQILLTNYVVKGRVIKIAADSPNLERIKNLYRAESFEEVDELERLCYNSADRYNNFNNEWVDLTVVARELPLDLYWSQKELERANFIESEDSHYSYFAYFTDIVAPNNSPPFEFYLPRIKEIIIAKRKESLLKELEKELINDAIESNRLKSEINQIAKDESRS